MFPQVLSQTDCQRKSQRCGAVGAGLRCDLGCGASVLLIMLVKLHPKSTLHGFEISTAALEKAKYNVAAARLSNVVLHDANQVEEQLSDYHKTFNVSLVYDVLQDLTNPENLVEQLRVSPKPDGTSLLGEISCKENILSRIHPRQSQQWQWFQLRLIELFAGGCLHCHCCHCCCY